MDNEHKETHDAPAKPGSLGEHTRTDHDGERRQQIVVILVNHFKELLEADPEAFRRKFRKMAASPFAFYRGSACLFYSDMASRNDASASGPASRVWIQGDLHAENFGTYMNSQGALIFDVNDFDEAYVGHFAWDLKRLAASIALLGHVKAFSDEEITEIVRACALAYVGQIQRFASGESDREFALTLANTEGPLHEALESASIATRAELLDRLTVVEGCHRRLRRDARSFDLDDETRSLVEDAYRDYLTTLPEPPEGEPRRVKDIVRSGGFGIGSAGLPVYTLLLQGDTEALETDIILSMKQANVCAPSRVVDDPNIRDYFQNHGHRTALSQRALQAHADPWLGYTTLSGVGQIVSELSPYEADLEWDAIADPAEMLEVVRPLGQAVAKIHSVADEHGDESLVPFSSEQAIAAEIGSGSEFASDVAEFALAYAELVRDDHRRFVDAFRNHEIPGLR